MKKEVIGTCPGLVTPKTKVLSYTHYYYMVYPNNTTNLITMYVCTDRVTDRVLSTNCLRSIINLD